MLLHSIAVAAVLLGSTIATPHNKHHHHPADLPFQSSKYPTAPVAPTGTGVASAGQNSTGHFTVHYGFPGNIASPVSENHGTSATPLETPPDLPQPVAVDKHKAHSESAAEPCDGGTVTVTLADVVTVTVQAEVTESSLPQSSDEAQPVIPTAKASSTDEAASTPSKTPSQIVSPVAPVPVSSAQPDESAAPAPVSSTAAEETAVPASSSAPAAESSSPSNPAPEPPQQGGLPFKTKRGIIASGSTMNDIAAAMGVGKVSWLGNWYSAPPHTIAPSLTFVPQNYGKQSDVKGEWTRNAEQAVAKGDKYFLSFGEPGTPNDQLQMTPAEGAQLWREKMEPYAKQGVTIGAPGTLQNTQDFEWLSQFLDACNDCSVGFIAMHWFDKAGAAQVPGFKETLQKAKVIADKKGIPVWLDNFSAEGDAAAQKEFLSQVVPWLEEQDWIKAYAYVSPEVGKAGAGGNIVDGGRLDDLGSFYANL